MGNVLSAHTAPRGNNFACAHGTGFVAAGKKLPLALNVLTPHLSALLRNLFALESIFFEYGAVWDLHLPDKLARLPQTAMRRLLPLNVLE